MRALNGRSSRTGRFYIQHKKYDGARSKGRLTGEGKYKYAVLRLAHKWGSRFPLVLWALLALQSMILLSWYMSSSPSLGGAGSYVPVAPEGRGFLRQPVASGGGDIASPLSSAGESVVDGIERVSGTGRVRASSNVKLQIGRKVGALPPVSLSVPGQVCFSFECPRNRRLSRWLSVQFHLLSMLLHSVSFLDPFVLGFIPVTRSSPCLPFFPAVIAPYICSLLPLKGPSRSPSTFGGCAIRSREPRSKRRYSAIMGECF